MPLAEPEARRIGCAAMTSTRRLLLVLVPVLVLAAALPSAAGAKTLWLCKPGLANDVCTPSLKTTKFSPTGKRLGVSNVRRVRRPKFDCFYVYPTVSDVPGNTAPLRVDPEQRSIALYQAARYSRDCRVYAPIYRQATIAGIFGGATTQDRERAYRDVRAAWRDYLKKHNKGRGVVLIGHSQGTFVLRELIKREIDPKPRERKRLISAVLLGGNVLVAKGKDRGGDFKRLRACRSSRQLQLHRRVRDLPGHGAGRQPLRPHLGAQPRGAVHQPGRAGRRSGHHDADLSHAAVRPRRHRRRHRADGGRVSEGEDRVGLDTGRLPRALLARRRRERAAGHEP